MEDVCGKLTVFFEEPFWVGLFERTQGDSLCVSKVIFGAEPKECEVLTYVLEHYHDHSQQALQAQREMMKVARKIVSKEEQEAEAQRRFELRQQKKKEKKRGH